MPKQDTRDAGPEVPTLPELLTRVEAAALLKLSPQTLANWQATGRVKLPVVKIGNRAVRYRRSDLEALIAAGVATE